MAVSTDTRMFDDLPVAVALVDGEGLIRYVNPAAVLGEGLPERLGGSHVADELQRRAVVDER